MTSLVLCLVPLLLLGTVSATYRYQYPGSSPYGNLPFCRSLPAYHIAVDTALAPVPSSAPAPEPVRSSFFTYLGAPDSNGLRVPLPDTSIPENASSLSDASLQQLFTDLESDNTSVLQPNTLTEPAGCPVLDGSFLGSLPSIPGSSPTISTAFYLYCYTRCYPVYEWKVLPPGHFPRYVRLAYCPRRNCSIPLGQTCQAESQRYIIVLKQHCCQQQRVELVPNPTRPIPTLPSGGQRIKSVYYPYRLQPAYRQVVRTELKCGYYRVRIPTASTCRCACNQRLYRGRK